MKASLWFGIFSPQIKYNLILQVVLNGVLISSPEPASLRMDGTKASPT